MKYFLTLAALFLFLCLPYGHGLYGQGTMQAKNMMVSGPRNYKSFTAPGRNVSAEAGKSNAGFEQHPELGQLFAEAPCSNCYELIGKRTAISKTFIKEGTGGRSIMQQTSSMPMHYKDAQGNWRTIMTQLQQAGAGVYAATHQESPVNINVAGKTVSLGKSGQLFEFNHNLELVYLKADNTEVPLGAANWTRYTAGDDGVYVTNAWPGIDMEVFVLRGTVKTNFWINRAMPAYAGGKLLVRDHFQLGAGMSLYSEGKAQYAGNLEIRNNSGEKVYAISAATAFERNDIKNTLRIIDYRINGNVVDIALPGDFLNRPASAYPVVIDPLVSTVSSVTGSTYSAPPLWTVGCVYNNPATVPAMVTINDIQFSFQYVTSGGALLNNGAFDFKLGSCRSPSPTGLFWNCNSTLTGTCTGTGASIFSSLNTCLPAPQCVPFDLNITMDFYQNYLSDPPCSNLYITAGSPLTITIFGQTIGATNVSASPSSICQGQSTTLSAVSSLGVPPYTYTWNPGAVTGSPVVLSPTVTTTYTVTGADACGNPSVAVKTITVSPATPITGTTSICSGTTTVLSNSILGGAWSSSNPGVATVGASSGVLSGVTAGTAIVTYTTPAGCGNTATVTIFATPPAITGSTSVCQGSTTTLSNTTAGGTWASSATGTATVNPANGVVGGVAAGTAFITYTAPGGCHTTVLVTVNAITPVSGLATECIGGTTTYTDATPGGTWASGSPGIAIINATSGALTGMSIGTAAVTYTTAAGCMATTTVTINVLTPIAGSNTVCQGSTITLSDPTPGGIWTSGSPATASVGASTGIVSGISAGNAPISYTASGGCITTTTILVNPLAAITGATTLCVDNMTTLSDATPGGTWSSTNTAVATAVAATGQVSGVAAGAATIKYTTPAGCIASLNLNVIAPPVAITGSTTVCQGSTTALSDATPGGTWASSSVATATVVTSTGAVYGVSGGTTSITYTTAPGCFAATPVLVNPLALIVGSSALCPGTNTLLTDATPGGTWSSSTPSVATVEATTGNVTGVTNGTAAINYTTAAGCIATRNMTGNPAAPINGSTAICTRTTLSNAISGGTWASSATTIASVGATTGIVTGFALGTSTITYTTSGGCVATLAVSVNPLAPITGAGNVCAGSSTTLSNAAPGGTWTSTSPATASVDPVTGLVAGVSAGTATIRYSTFVGCVSSLPMTVNPVASITGAVTVCQGSASTLSNAVAGGTWFSDNTAVAAIGITTGTVSGLTPGTANITYTTPAGCISTTVILINPLASITGTGAVCAGQTTTLHDATPGGTWSSISTSIASINVSTGVLTGILAGSTSIRYTTPAGCIASFPMTVNAMPSAITGARAVCVGSNTTLSNSLPGGVWASVNTTVATAGVSSGIVGGVAADTVSVSYTTTGGCAVSALMTINPLPAAITGTTSICENALTTLHDATAGGSWTSSNTTIATVGITSGGVTALLAGTTNIQYTTPLGCFVTLALTVHPLPAAITGATTVCEGYTTTLSNTLPGGAWSSNLPPIAAVNAATGVVTGVLHGTTTISYTTPFGCYAVTDVLVNPTPKIAGHSFTNPTKCTSTDGTITLSGLVPGASYTVNYSYGSTPITAILTANSLGNVVITGLRAGPYINFSVTSTLGCTSDVMNSLITLVLPSAPPMSVAGSNAPLCDGSALHLTATNTVTGVSYSWSGPAGFTSTLQNPIINAAAMNIAAGTYSVTASIYECVSAPATTNVVIHPIPNIAKVTSTDPKTCLGTEGTITLSGLSAGLSYAVLYDHDGNPGSATVVADAYGKVLITGLSFGLYSHITASSYTCVSNDGGLVTLTDPLAPPAPIINSNSPVCSGKTLIFRATDDVAGVTYHWEGPNSFISDLQNPELPNIALADSGDYTLTVRFLNCPATAATHVMVHPPVTLTHVTPSQVIPIGSSIKLHAEGALLYVWTPYNGTIDLPNIDTPTATPQETITYTVQGMNEWGCLDSAQVTITVDYNINEFVPTGFTPNGDGNNDIFRIGNIKYDKLVDFSIFNRWGQLIYHNTSDPAKGWDGTFNGKPQDMGTYNYSIILETPEGKLKNMKGDVTLLR